jgi:hypothetical protein
MWRLFVLAGSVLAEGMTRLKTQHAKF